jgi:hypothetical protein
VKRVKWWEVDRREEVSIRLRFVFGGEQYDEILIALGGLRLGEKFEV